MIPCLILRQCAYLLVELFARKKTPTLWLKNSCHLQQYRRKEIMQGKYSSSYFYAVKQICRNATNAAETQGVNKRCLLTGPNPHQYTLTTTKRIMLRWKWCFNEISGLHTVWIFFCCSRREWHCIFVFFIRNKNTMKIDGLSERKPLSTECSENAVCEPVLICENEGFENHITGK